jgi:hypothetical protein
MPLHHVVSLNMGPNTGPGAARAAVWHRTGNLDSEFQSAVVKAPSGTVAVRMEELGNGAAVVDREEICLGFFVVPPVKKGSDCGISTASTPALSGRDQPWKFDGWCRRIGHTVTAHDLDNLSTSRIKIKNLELPEMRTRFNAELRTHPLHER